MRICMCVRCNNYLKNITLEMFHFYGIFNYDLTDLGF